MDRRAFIGAMTGAAAGLVGLVSDRRIEAAPRALQVAPGRREVFVGSHRARVIDVHGHCIFREELEVVGDTPLAPNISRQLDALVLGPGRLAALDRAGIDVQVLTHQGAWWYGADRALADRIVAVQNERLAAWCRAHPERFVGLASVSLQHPDLAVAQLEHAVGDLGLRGVGLSGHVDGEPLSAPRYDPFWARAEQLGGVVFIHPQGAANVVREDGLSGRGDLGNIIGNPLETTVALSRLIVDGTLDRFPRLRVCAAHAGGYLPSYLGRLDVACEVRGNADCANTKRPRDYFRSQILVDSMIFSEEGLRHLVAEIGAGQIVYGTDMPYNWPVGVDLVLDAAFLSDADKAAILGGNLSRLLGLA